MDVTLWEASGLKAKLGVGKERLSVINSCAITNEAGKVYLCLVIQLLHRTSKWKGKGEEEGKMNREDFSLSSVC